MDLDEAVTDMHLVAGIGFRRGTSSEAIVALVRRALTEVGRGDTLVAIATAADRATDPAIREAAAAFGLVPLAIEAEALAQADPRVPTRSERIERLRGVGSLAEAAALAVVGDAGRLILARIDDGQATCALATIADGVMGGRVFSSSGAGDENPTSPNGEMGYVDSRAGVRNEPPVSSADRQPDPSSASERAATAQIATP